MELKVKDKALPGNHFRIPEGPVLKESFIAKPGVIYEVVQPVKLGTVNLENGDLIQLAFKNTKAVFYRQLPTRAAA